MSEDIERLSEQISRLAATFEDYKLTVDNRIRSVERAHIDDSRSHGAIAAGLSSSAPLRSTEQCTPEINNSPTSHELQSRYRQVRDAYSKHKLPNHVIVPEAKSGKRETQPLATAINRGARYAETALKVVWSLEDVPEHLSDQLGELSSVLQANIAFLQEEQANVFVKNNFDTDTARIFRSLQGSSVGFAQSTVENMHIAANLASASTRATRDNTSRPRQDGQRRYQSFGSQQAGSYQNFQSAGRNRFQRGGYHHQRSDNYTRNDNSTRDQGDNA